MPTNLVQTICFSPTRTTARIVAAIARGTQLPAAEPLDLTPPEARTRRIEAAQNALAIIGAPVYGGRIPPEATHRLQRLTANGVPAGLVVVYGNRAYEDALLELRDLVIGLGFVPIAAAAFVGEHSYSTEATPIAHGRPDALDLAQAQAVRRVDPWQAGGAWRVAQDIAVACAGRLPAPRMDSADRCGAHHRRGALCAVRGLRTRLPDRGDCHRRERDDRSGCVRPLHRVR